MKYKILLIIYSLFLMVSPSSWEFYKEDQAKILWIHICSQDLKGVSISINKWWKSRYPEYKIRIVSKNQFEHLKKVNCKN